MLAIGSAIARRRGWECVQICQHSMRWKHSGGEKKTPQQERAIRLKSQEKARSRVFLRSGDSFDDTHPFKKKVYGNFSKADVNPPQTKGYTKNGGSSSQPMISATSLRDKRYKASQGLMKLLHADMSATDACDVAIKKVMDMKPFVRRSSYVYNPLLRHLLRAGRGMQAIKTLQVMKKNGVSPTLETFRALYMGSVPLKLQADRDTNLIQKFIATFDQFVEFWNDAIRHDQGVKNVEKVDEEVKFTPKQIKYTNTTGDSYRTTEIEAWESAITEYGKFCRTMDQYLEFLLYLRLDEKAARVCLDSAELAKPSWSKSGKNYAPGLVQTLARRLLAHDHKTSENLQDEEVWREAVEFAQLAIKDEEGNRALRSLDRREEENRWKYMQRSDRFSLALTDEDRRQLFDEEVVDDEPPKHGSRV